MRKALYTFLSGMAIGAADLVPGISGGTIAFIIGIYYRLLASIQAFDTVFLRLLMTGRFRGALGRIPWPFLLPLGAGVACSIFGLARGVTFLLDSYPIVVWSFFFGLIVSSLFIIGRSIPFKGARNVLPFLAGFCLAWALAGANTFSVEPSLPIYFCSAFLAVCALILPGISGASILVLLGQYRHIIQAVADLDWTVLAVFATGCLCGLLSFARVVSAFLKRFPIGGTSLLIGMMLGSLRIVWPWQANGYPSLPQSLDATVVIALFCCLAGAVLPLALQAFSARKPRAAQSAEKP